MELLNTQHLFLPAGAQASVDGSHDQRHRNARRDDGCAQPHRATHRATVDHQRTECPTASNSANTTVNAPRAIASTPGHAAPACSARFFNTADMALPHLVSSLNLAELSLTGCICKPVLVL